VVVELLDVVLCVVEVDRVVVVLCEEVVLDVDDVV
jgi:hypothetical protein